MSSITSSQLPQLTRRGLLCGASALSVLSLMSTPAQALAGGLTDEGFLALSQKLVGQEGLSKDLAARMLQAFSGAGRTADLVALAAGNKNDDLANAIVAGWYTGESPDPKDAQVLDYTDTLIWDAMDYTKPMGYCGGATGYWADPPEA